MSLTGSFSCPRCGRIYPAPVTACESCGWVLVAEASEEGGPPAPEQKRHISRRTVLLGLAGGAGAIALGGGGWIWYLKTRRPQLLTYTGHQGAAVTALVWSLDGNTIATGDANGVVRVWDAGTGETRQTCQMAEAQGVASLAWKPGGSSLLAGYSNMLAAWDAQSGKPTFTTTRLTGPAAYSLLGNYKPCYLAYPLLLAACQGQRVVQVFSVSSLDAPLAALDSGHITTLAFAPYEERLDLACITDAQELVVYGAALANTCSQNDNPNTTISYQQADLSASSVSNASVLSISWGPGGGYLLGGQRSRNVAIQGEWGRYEMDHPAEVVAAALNPAQQHLPPDAHPDGWYTVIGYIATADNDGTVRIWGNEGQYMVVTQTHQPVLQLAWSPDGTFLAVVTADGVVQVHKANLSNLPAIWRNTSFN
jgi:WD40 repeat protein